jgi:hypothetical protein
MIGRSRKVDKPTVQIRLHEDTCTILRTIAAVKGVSVAEMFDDLVLPVLPTSICFTDRVALAGSLVDVNRYLASRSNEITPK